MWTFLFSKCTTEDLLLNLLLLSTSTSLSFYREKMRSSLSSVRVRDHTRLPQSWRRTFREALPLLSAFFLGVIATVLLTSPVTRNLLHVHAATDRFRPFVDVVPPEAGAASDPFGKYASNANVRIPTHQHPDGSFSQLTPEQRLRLLELKVNSHMNWLVDPRVGATTVIHPSFLLAVVCVRLLSSPLFFVSSLCVYPLFC